MTELIEFREVSKFYGDIQVLKNINLTIQKGDFFILVGPSGSGKTTVLKMINALIEPSEGDVYFNGKRIKDYDIQQLRWQIGYVLQKVALFPTMTVAENIEIVPELLGWSKEKRRERSRHLLESVDMKPDLYMNRMPDELSGGQQQRIGILRGLAAQPDILLMDEPFSALDPLSRQSLQDEVLNIHQQIGVTIVFVTHNMDEALKLGSSIGIIREGELLQVTSPEDLQASDNHAFVNQFFGKSINQEAQKVSLGQLSAWGYSQKTSENPQSIFSSKTKLQDIYSIMVQEECIGIKQEDGSIHAIDRARIFEYLSQN